MSWLSVFSLRARFIGAIALLVSLFGFMAVIAVDTWQTAATMIDSNMEESLEELAPILALERQVYRIQRPLCTYFAADQTESLDEFSRLSAQVDVAFAEALQAPFGIAAERHAVRIAQEEWRLGWALAQQLLSTPTPPANGEAIRQISERLDRAVDALDQMRAIAHMELTGRVATTDEAVRKARLVTFAALAFGVGIAFAVGVTILRSVFGRLQRIEHGTQRVADGDLSARVDVQGGDELTRFGETFNMMAERLQQTREALELLATRDGLTRLHNHSEFYRRLAAEFSRSQRFAHPLSLLLVDIDHFKLVNDRFGHLCGDRVLRSVAKALVQQIRPADQAARYGGEEFVVILPEIDHAGAMATAERIRRTIEERTVTVGHECDTNVTVSIGVATCPPHANTPEQLIFRADAAMYAAKRAGRNRCVSADVTT